MVTEIIKSQYELGFCRCRIGSVKQKDTDDVIIQIMLIVTEMKSDIDNRTSCDL